MTGPADPAAARREAEEALREWGVENERANSERRQMALYACAKALRSLLAATEGLHYEGDGCPTAPAPSAPTPPDTVEHPCGCFTLAGDRCYRHVEASPPPASEVLARFGAAMLAEWWNDGNPGDIDGGEVQEIAEKHGLWHQVERHADGVECEWCGNEGPCGELTEAGLAVIAAPEVSR